MHRGVIVLWALAALAVLGGFGGAVHPAGDSLAVFRVYTVAGLALISATLLILRRPVIAFAGLALVIGAGMTLVLPRDAETPAGRSYAVYQKNLKWSLRDPEALIADITAQASDFVTLQEVTRRNRAVMAGLAARWPHQHFCDFERIGGTAVLSHWPVVEGSAFCETRLGLSAMQVATPDGPVWLASLHLHWPWPHRQPGIVADLLPVLARLEGPVVLAGDFNMVPWSHTVAMIEQAARARVVGRPGATFDLRTPLIRIPIDHVLMPEDAVAISATLRPKLGSDHRGVLAKFGFKPAP
ncbi:MAG: endonuclease [Rhodobacteraceae bacterium]|nr:endonuclease [Paracoccaceae bacterium]